MVGRTAVIAGGGIGGLTAALALARRGWAVTVAEKAEAFAEVGAGVQLSPNAMHVLRALGLEDALRRVSCAPGAAAIRDGRSGRVMVRAPLGIDAERRYGAPYLNVHRADLHGVLLRACEGAGVALRTGAAAAGYEAKGLRLASGAVLAGELIVGADGIRSAIRSQMLGEAPARYTGYAAWRAMVSAAALPPGLVPDEATSWTGRGRHVVTYPVRGGAAVNLVAVTRRAWTEEGWTTTGDASELRAAFAGWHEVVGSVLRASEGVGLWGLFDRPPARRWTDGSACLLGDAAHPILPFMAQGAAMAIEDAWVLADEAEGDVPASLVRYAARRGDRTRTVQRRATANAGLFHREGLASAKLAVAGALPALARRRFDAVYGADVTAR